VQDPTHSFGYWLRRRRKALDLTQDELARRVFCSGFSIRKIEADDRRPSRRLAERLADTLAIPADERAGFLDAARALRATDPLPLDAAPVEAPVVRAGGDASAPSSGPVPKATAADIAPLVGRAAELAVLTGLVAALPDAAGGTVLVEGEPGIGKSRLMREAARFAEAARVPVLASNCYEIERAIPYQPVIELINRALDHMPDTALRGLAPVSLAELAALVPEIGERVPGLPQLSNDFPEARRARLPRALVQLLEAGRDAGPLVVMVDDIQWADDASAQVLHHLARHAAERSLLLIYAYRDEAADNDERFAHLIDSLHRNAGARRLPLGRLAPDDAGLLVEALAGAHRADAGLARSLHRETDGNPFFLISILQSMREGRAQPRDNADMMPDTLLSAVRARLAHVPREARTVLETAAVLGRRFEFDTLLDVTGEEEAALLAAAEALVRRHLWREEPEGGVYDFSHDKLREVVYRDIGGARRRLLHQSVAEALERRGEDGRHEHDAQLAEHCERAHLWPKAMRHLLLAGDRSLALFATRDALHWLDRAVSLIEAHPEAIDPERRVEIHARRGAARALAGQGEGAVADLRRVVDAARAAGEHARIRDALVRLGMAYRRADAYDDAVTCLREALDESRAANEPHHAADTLYHLGTVAWSTGKNDQAIRFHQEAVALCEQGGFDDLVAVQAFHGRGEAHFANAEPASAIECYSKSLGLARRIGDRSYECENLMMIGHACLGTKGLGDYPRAIGLFESSLAIARAADLQWHMGPTLLGLDHARACLGDYGAAWSGMRKTLDWLRSLGQVRYQLIAHDFIGHLLLDLGRDEQALIQMDRALALVRESGIDYWAAALVAHRAIALCRLGRDDALGALHSALERTRGNAERYLLVRCLDAAAEISLAAGDVDACLAHAGELLDIALPNNLAELEAVARRWRGEALMARGAVDEAIAELSRAAARASGTGRVRLCRDLDAALARALVAAGDRARAATHEAAAAAITARMAASVAGAQGPFPSTEAGSA
jgi:tetratricopeptide (TPR) repeat protein/transcriptional regulator with XRE-family HTH domain